LISAMLWRLLSAVASSFAASFVEFVEVFTIVLAVALTRGWRPALIGSGAGLGFWPCSCCWLDPCLRSRRSTPWN